MPLYKFHICVHEGETRYIAEEIETLVEAMERAVVLAFEYGAENCDADIRGHFICVFNKHDVEVFRTPLATHPWERELS